MSNSGEIPLPPGWRLDDAYAYDKSLRGASVIVAPGHFLDGMVVRDGSLRPYKAGNNTSVFIPNVPKQATLDLGRGVLTYPDKNDCHPAPVMQQYIQAPAPTIPTTIQAQVQKPKCAWVKNGIPCQEHGTGPVLPSDVEGTTIEGLYCHKHRKSMAKQYFREKAAAAKANEPPPAPAQPSGRFSSLPSIKPQWDSPAEPEPEHDDPPVQESDDVEPADDEPGVAALLRQRQKANKSVEAELKRTKQHNGLKAEKIKAVKLQAQAQELGVTFDEPTEDYGDEPTMDMALPDEEEAPAGPPPIDPATLEANTDAMMYLVNGIMWGVELGAPVLAKQRFGKTIRTDGLYENYVNDEVAQQAAREALQEQFPDAIASLGPTARALIHMGRVITRTVTANALADQQKAVAAAVPKPVVDALANEYKDM
jgi:hypothetical protein